MDTAVKMPKLPYTNTSENVKNLWAQLELAKEKERKLRAELVFNKKLQEDVRELLAKELVKSGNYECLSVNWARVREMFGLGGGPKS